MVRDDADYLVGQAALDLQAPTVLVNWPPGSGSFAGEDEAVEIVTELVPRMFTTIYDDGSSESRRVPWR